MPRGDGRLNLDLDPAERGPQDACGVFGVWSGDRSGDDPTEVAKLTYFGLYALQHRGQESAGIAVSNGSQILVYKDMGLVAQVFDESHLSSLRGHLAIGHTRYSTTGSSVWENAQPTFRSTAAGSVALGHNGNLTNTRDLLELVEKRAAESGELPYDGAAPSQDETRRWREGVRGHAAMHSTTDTEIITALLASYPDRSLEQAALEVLPQLRGAFSLVFMDEETLYAARDPQGIRPLVLGRLERGWVVASETAALDIVGAAQVREIEPGELIAIDAHGLRSSRFAEAEPKGCLFEYVYLARPDTKIAGRSVHATRVEVGRKLAEEAPADADLVIPVPESGTPAAVGYSQGSGIPYGLGLVKNSYVGRTFIQPSQTIRQLGIRLKLNPLREVIAGQAAGRGRRLDRARQHPAGPGADAARGRRRRGPRAHLVAAGEVAVLLRHRLRLAGRADRQRAGRRGDPRLDRRRLAGVHLAGGAGRGHRAADRQPVPGLLRRGLPGARCPSPSCSASTCSSWSRWSARPRPGTPLPASAPSLVGGAGAADALTRP